MKDLTDQKKFEEIKRKAQRWSTVAEVSAGMAHEIRNPLASISGSIEVLRDQLQLTDGQSRLMNIIIRESDRLNKLISDFLDLARPRIPDFYPVKIVDLLSEIIVLLKTCEGFKDSIKYSCNVNPDSLDVELDRDQITQMIWNLVKNAMEAMPNGGLLSINGFVCDNPGSSQRVLDLHPDPPFFRLIIEDNGIGMDQGILSRIFDPFTTFKRRGVGIGLAIVYRIVENHKGAIRVVSKLGKGTSFLIDIPLRQSERSESADDGGVTN
ncbi:PAS domain-containing sensor histidine kinase, partial [bacterium]|nr:PAS domain-containing sensor histidine kinase [bacterium]